MTVYIDTSVVLRVVFRHVGALATWGQWTTAYSSILWHTEALRAIDRARLGGAISDAQVSQLRTDIEVIHGHFNSATPSDSTLSLTHDTQLATAAAASGFTVQGV